MLKLNRIIVISLALALLYACGDQAKETKSGHPYTVISAGDGGQLKDDNVTILSFKMLIDDSVYFNLSEATENPLILKQDTTWENRGVFFEMMPMLSLGDSIHTTVNAGEFFTTGFKSMPPAGITPDQDLELRMKVEKHFTEEEYEAYMQEKMQEAMEAQQKQDEEQIGKDLEVIENFLSENNIEAQNTESGLHYVITKKGYGTAAENGQQVRVNYKGMLLDGTVFDTSYEEAAKEANVYNPQRNYEPFQFSLGVGQVIRGWDEGIALLTEGAKATLYIPSVLAYGARGAGGTIPPNACLMFEVELVEVVK